MIDYETYCKIRDHRDRQGLTITQTALALGLHPETGLDMVSARALPAAGVRQARQPS